MSDDRIDLGELRKKAEARPLIQDTPIPAGVVLALVEAAEALQRIASVPCQAFGFECGQCLRCVARAALSRFRWEDTP